MLKEIKASSILRLLSSPFFLLKATRNYPKIFKTDILNNRQTGLYICSMHIFRQQGRFIPLIEIRIETTTYFQTLKPQIN